MKVVFGLVTLPYLMPQCSNGIIFMKLFRLLELVVIGRSASKYAQLMGSDPIRSFGRRDHMGMGSQGRT